MRYSSGMRSRSTAASRSSSNLARCSSSWAASSLSAYLHKWTGFQEQPCPGTICFRLLYKTTMLCWQWTMGPPKFTVHTHPKNRLWLSARLHLVVRISVCGPS